jgi:hypothetical protein
MVVLALKAHQIMEVVAGAEHLLLVQMQQVPRAAMVVREPHLLLVDHL